MNEALALGLQAKDAGKRLVVSYGEYDPLLAENAERLASRKNDECWQVVAVLPGKEPLLPLEARCKLVAALRAVDCVVAFEQSPTMLQMAAGKAALYDDRQADAAAREGLIAQIHAKQKLEKAAE